MAKLKQFVMWIVIISLPGLVPACATVQPVERIRAEVRDGSFASRATPSTFSTA